MEKLELLLGHDRHLLNYLCNTLKKRRNFVCRVINLNLTRFSRLTGFFFFFF